MIEGASSYGGIYADISGRFNSYNTVYCKYNLIHYGQFKLSGRTNEQVLMYENTIPDDTIIQRYSFVNTDNYVGISQLIPPSTRNPLSCRTRSPWTSPDAFMCWLSM